MKGTRFAWRAQQHRLPSIPHALHALWSALRWNSDEDAAALSLKPHLGVRPHLLPSAAKHLVSTLANHPELRESATPCRILQARGHPEILHRVSPRAPSRDAMAAIASAVV
jgi:hypothetical protein